jgi:hypothetical protein
VNHLNISAVSTQAAYQASQQALASARTSALQQALGSTSGKKPDGDGDHGVEPNAVSGGSKTGQLLNALA